MEISLANLLVPAALIASRISGLLLYAPVLGGEALPMRIKIVLMLALTALLYPVCAPRMAGIEGLMLPLLMIKEIAVGIGLGIATNLVFDAAQFAGQMLSVQLGYSLASIFDPTTQVESTVMAVFHQMIATLIFLRLDVHLWIIRAIAGSFRIIPPQQLALTGGFAAAVVHGAGAVFVFGLEIAAPVLSATLIADVAVGILGKASPQMQSMLLGIATKSVLGMVVLAVSLVYWPGVFERLFTQGMVFTEKLLVLAHA